MYGWIQVGEKMVVHLLVGCYEVEKKKKKSEIEKIEKEREKLKKHWKKEKQKRVWNNVVLISDVCWFEIWNEEEVWLKFYCLKLCGSNYSLRFRKVFVSISFRTYHLFVNQATLQPWKALEILAFIFSM